MIQTADSSEHIVNPKAIALRTILSLDAIFEIPDYQRPYAWEEKHVSRLMKDLFFAWKNESDNEYFMGSVVFAGTDKSKRYLVIDGQQRLTTLLLLVSAARQICKEETGDLWRSLLVQNQNSTRLSVRTSDRVFFRNLIERGDGSSIAQSDPQIRMKEAFGVLKNFLSDKDIFPAIESIRQFLDFVLDRGIFVLIRTTAESTALKMFQKLNATGLDLSNADLIKAWMLGLFDSNIELRSEYATGWDALVLDITKDATHQNNAGRNPSDEFEAFLGFVRMLYMRKKQERGLYDEWTEQFNRPEFQPREDNPCPVFDDILTPLGKAYRAIMTADSGTAERAGQNIATTLQWLNRIDFSDWRLVVIALFRSAIPVEQRASFLSRFERLVAYLLLANKRTSTRLARYFAILDEFDSYVSEGNPFESKFVELTKSEIEDFQRILEGDIYNEIKGNRVKYLFSRINSFLSDVGTSLPFDKLSIEHVLPQNPTHDNDSDAGPQWEEWWNRDEREKWTHRLGNLIPLSLTRNISAQNFTFRHKLRVYLDGKDNTTAASAFLTRIFQDGPNGQWTPEKVEQNQIFLLKKCVESWDLYPEKAPVSHQTNEKRRSRREMHSVIAEFQEQISFPQVEDAITREFADDLFHIFTNKEGIHFQTKTMNEFFPPNITSDKYGFYRFFVSKDGQVGLLFHPGKGDEGEDWKSCRDAIRKRLSDEYPDVWRNLNEFQSARTTFNGENNHARRGTSVKAFTWPLPQGVTIPEAIASLLQRLHKWELELKKRATGTSINTLPADTYTQP